MSKVRRASHAGSWYSANRDELNQQLTEWMDQAPTAPGTTRAVIAPHAGYYYCGACSGHVYKQIDGSKFSRVFILGPSHHARLAGCALSSLEKYETPLTHLTIDSQVYADLYATGEFESMSSQTDEAEHSIEMQLPYIAKVMESRQGQFTIVPVMVGSLSTQREQIYGQIFSRYLADPENLFVISSDFCHWGSRFHYDYYDSTQGEIWQSIEHIDRMGMDLIEKMDPVAFSDYLKQYQNTICGRHPISVLLNGPLFHTVSAVCTVQSLQVQPRLIGQLCRSHSDHPVTD
ncbi:hypothetical protein NP493_828g01016 [Ridgeia piscesae]|uniref:Protein MEMO1 n=1 Tax=Ridgeia piscesae TaxID=27915 RepID=A0AAD9KMT5_RIDPI|nr:hypothetical protein NP493_828g01016 [Ridgeia piscesae]